MVRSAYAAGFFRPWPGLAAFLLIACAIGVQSSRAADIYRIEEDWEMVINEPDSSIHSPQLTFFLPPNPADPDRYFQLQLNHAVDHEFSGGGFHVVAADGSEHLDSFRSSTYQPLVSHAQTVRWTSVMNVHGDSVYYHVKDGYAADWGSFGGYWTAVRMAAQGTLHFNAYDPSQSLEMIDIGFGGNRVESLVLRDVRLYRTDGTVSQVSVNRSP
ncbi:hypothetical protein [Candidatus Laterigemmans baculatus]|uniref:hypothetical protein n=1 Tax=Candidatus Laterigemmans baculatus TaxID=2770505 RepID=UPI00193BCE35|nr:hypothetical protein [Candidatus Laterigemmans baculatus]